MGGTTEQKFIDVSLKIFAEKGYKGATTRLIAEKAGFSELTLFRKFKNKENLFNKVLDYNLSKLKEEIDEAFEANISSDGSIFLPKLINDMTQIAENNYEFIFLSNAQKNAKSDSLRNKFVNRIRDHIQINLPGRDVDYDAFALSMYANSIMISQTKYYEQEWFDYDNALQGFINNALKLFGEK